VPVPLPVLLAEHIGIENGREGFPVEELVPKTPVDAFRPTFKATNSKLNSSQINSHLRRFPSLGWSKTKSYQSLRKSWLGLPRFDGHLGGGGVG
jgi:hypothetical protein